MLFSPLNPLLALVAGATALSDNALLNATYDYIIVGGGTSGLTVANRLTENGKCTVHPYPNEPSTGSLP
jgi:ribulose 1,5-bisphosphate synthetase/thiazole synthase